MRVTVSQRRVLVVAEVVVAQTVQFPYKQVMIVPDELEPPCKRSLVPPVGWR